MKSDQAKMPEASATTETSMPVASRPDASAQTQQTAEAGSHLQNLSADQYLVSDLYGASLYASEAEDAETVGEIQNFLLSNDGTIVAAIVDANVGDESRTLAIPFDQITWTMGKDNEPRAVLSLGAEQMTKAPAFTTPEEQQTEASAEGNVAAPAGEATPETAAASAAGVEFPTRVGPDQYLSKDIIGAEVYSGPGEDAEEIGEIYDLVLASSGKIDAGVIGVGGFLGIGEKDVAVPFDQFQLTREADHKDGVRLTLAASKEQLEKSTSFDAERPGQMAATETGAVEATAETQQAANVEASTEKSAEATISILATRTFVGPHDVPPTATAAYGIVAFPNLAMPTTRARYLAVCHAYWAAMQESSGATAPVREQMVTVWPVQSERIAEEIISDNDMLGGCQSAVDRYDLGTGQLAIRHANVGRQPALRGIGPYLLAWSPSSAKGDAGVPILLLDLSGATNETQFLDYFTTWKNQIELRPELWDENDGWWLEEIRRRFSEFSDETGGPFITFWMGGSK
ncbi:PRC-barrel domain-containing protein [Aurantimonas sp. A3-2-R12]|uniref:PRC-barrel domain-containing protein n=1 Tax=Aurantimonas sp. A3-2-R12 TaxID=3114362 RepID=UPI002E196827|nr:PRC-barrel domain-containing protein [Aurantimonas sp. A3-2-R12]